MPRLPTLPMLMAPAAAAFSLLELTARAQEYSITPDSTVIGRNYGYPTGTPTRRDPANPEGRTELGDLDFVAESAFFLKNLEITGFPDSRDIDGETFIGILAPLRLRYRAAEEVTVEGGAVLGHNFGDDEGLDVAEPLVRLVYEPANDFYFVAGTLIRTHWIHDALLDDAHAFRVNAEQGLQFRADTGFWKNDSWINWRVREEPTRAEQFEVGNSTEFRWWGLRADGQMLWAHTGGQGNSTNHVEDNIALAFGGSMGLEGTGALGDDSPLKDVRLEGTYYFSHDDDRLSGQETPEGRGYEFALNADFRPRENWLLRGFASYFHGNDFAPDRGDMLYTLDDYAQLGATSFWELPGGLRAETTIVAQQTDDNLNYTFAVYLTWGKAFRLWHEQ